MYTVQVISVLAKNVAITTRNNHLPYSLFINHTVLIIIIYIRRTRAGALYYEPSTEAYLKRLET